MFHLKYHNVTLLKTWHSQCCTACDSQNSVGLGLKVESVPSKSEKCLWQYPNFRAHLETYHLEIDKPRLSDSSGVLNGPGRRFTMIYEQISALSSCSDLATSFIANMSFSKKRLNAVPSSSSHLRSDETICQVRFVGRHLMFSTQYKASRGRTRAVVNTMQARSVFDIQKQKIGGIGGT